MMDLELSGRVVLVTGGTDGLGLALAERLVAEDAHVAICGRDRERLESTAKSLGDDNIAMRADVTSPSDLAAFVEAAVSRWSRIDGLVNNAGRGAAGPFEAVTDEEWVGDIDLKVMAAVRLTRLALPHLRASGQGAVINVLAVGAKAPGASSLPTTASRAAGLAITKALSKDLGPDNVRVNAVLIGLVESGQWRTQPEQSGQSMDEVYAQLGRGVPLGRVGRAEEFAD